MKRRAKRANLVDERHRIGLPPGQGDEYVKERECRSSLLSRLHAGCGANIPKPAGQYAAGGYDPPSAREATGGRNWDRVAELRRAATLRVGAKSGSLHTADDLRTGANEDGVEIDGAEVEHHADMPVQSWEQNAAGDVLLTPGGKAAADIDDLYIHRNGWWQPGFGGAAVTMLPPIDADGMTYDRLGFQVPGGSGFALWIDRSTHFITRLVRGNSVSIFSDFRKAPGGLTLSYREQRINFVITTTEVTALPEVDAADFQPPFRTDYTMPRSGEATVPARGGLTFQMKVNGKGPFGTIFDTGAVNLISARLAKQLGLKVDTPSLPFGAIGGATTAHTAHVDTLTIGDLVVRDQTFYVLDIPSNSNDPEMLVGWELMRRFAIRIDFQHNLLTFFDGPHFHYAGTGTVVPLILNTAGNGVSIRAKADDIPGLFTLDTGNQIGLFLNSGFVEANHLVAALKAHLHGYNGRGLGGPSPDAWFSRLHTLSIGNLEIPDPLVRLQTKPDGPNPNAGNIGQSVLNRFTVVLDCMRGVMYLEKTPDWDRREIFNRAGLLLDPADGTDQVMTVLPGSPAEHAGIEPGDRITSINGQTPADDPNDPLFLQPVGTVLHLKIKRGATVKTYDVTLADVL